MIDELQDLARRAVACKGWRWMPGMLAGDRDRVVYVDSGLDGALVSCGCPSGPDWMPEGALPDLSDPATLGCLLALVREAYDLPRLALVCCGGRWRVISAGLDVRFPIRAPAKNNAEAAALVAALESAEVRR